MKLIAIDPGTTHSGFAIMDDGYKILDKGKIENGLLLTQLSFVDVDQVVIECMEPRMLNGSHTGGQMIGAETYETCIWIGRYLQTAENRGLPVDRIYRHEERSRLIPSKKNKLPPLIDAPKTADARIRASLIRRFAQHDFKNGKGTKKKPDWFYGVTADTWQACAVGVVWLDKRKGMKK